MKESLLSSKEEVQFFQNKGFRVIPWTANKPEQWEKLLDIGVDGIITDYPRALKQYLRNP
jgi:glycerophosphoryl diester phosphodiesterase